MNNYYVTNPAPTNQIPTVHAGPTLSFSGSGKTMKMHLRFRLGQITTSAGSVFQFTVNGGPVISVAFTPQNSLYFPTYITNFVQQFRFVKLEGVQLEFLPRISTTTSATYMVASVDDPSWPEGVGIASGNAITPTEAVLSSLDNCCTVVGYNSCKMKVPISQSTSPGGWCYTFGPNDNKSQYNWTASISSDLRAAVPALIMIVGTGGSASTTYADMYMTCTICLKELTIAQTTSTLLCRLSSILSELPEEGLHRAMPIIESFYRDYKGEDTKTGISSKSVSLRSDSPVPSESQPPKTSVLDGWVKFRDDRAPGRKT